MVAPKTLKRVFGLRPMIRDALRRRLARSTLDREPTLIVLLYHLIEPNPPAYMRDMGIATRCSAFDDHMRWARRNFEVVALSEGIRRLRAGELKQTCIAVTMDDGFRTSVDSGLPILNKYDIPCTLFVSKELLVTQRYWMMDVANLEAHGRTQILQEVFGQRNGSAYTEYLRRDAPADVIAQRRLLMQRVDEFGDIPHHEHFDKAGLTDILRNSLVEIGNHSVDHPRFSRIDAEEQRRQIVENEEMLAQYPNYKRLFALPFGKPGDWNSDTVAVAADTRHEFVTACGGVNYAATTGFDIRRIPCDGVGVGELEEHIVRRGLCI